MVASMTAFARQAAQGEWGQAVWEIRSVNHRTLDLNFKISDNFREWEQTWRQLAAKILHRGKVDCFLTYRPSEQTSHHYELNKSLVDQLVLHGSTITKLPNIDSKLNPMDILRWPDVLTLMTQDLTPIKSNLTELFEHALRALAESRLREGQAIAEQLSIKLAKTSEHVESVSELLPQCRERFKEKILQKLSEIKATIDPQRLEQELVLYVQRMDVDEEMDRLKIHVNEAMRLLQQKGPSGRRLDFLMQEMGREANTLASKSSHHQVTKEAIELKVLIEQMREQIQNVE